MHLNTTTLPLKHYVILIGYVLSINKDFRIQNLTQIES